MAVQQALLRSLGRHSAGRQRDYRASRRRKPPADESGSIRYSPAGCNELGALHNRVRLAGRRHHQCAVLGGPGLLETTACVVSQTAKISGPAFNPAFATVGVDAAGNVGIVAESSTASTDLSKLLWTRRTTDPPNTFTGPTVIVAGTQPYTCLKTKNMETVGNAAGVLTALDPLDGTKLWTTGHWSNDATPCVWNTRIVEYQIAPTQTSPAKQSKSKAAKRP